MLDRRDPYRRRSARIAKQLIDRYGPIVQSGPFAGMTLPLARLSGQLSTLLVGSYEEELHAWVEQLIAWQPRRVINVGCDEGYYAIGFALRVPDADVYAFDIDVQAQRIARDAAQLNGVAGRVQVAGKCTSENLPQLVVPKTLLVVDCEGCENAILRPDLAPELASAAMLIELHDFIDPTTSTTVLGRFRDTHSIETIHATERIPTEYQVTEWMDPADRAAAVDDGTRPGELNFWAILFPKSS